MSKEVRCIAETFKCRHGHVQWILTSLVSFITPKYPHGMVLIGPLYIIITALSFVQLHIYNTRITLFLQQGLSRSHRPP
jgi:hypothetical protein